MSELTQSMPENKLELVERFVSVHVTILENKLELAMRRGRETVYLNDLKSSTSVQYNICWASRGDAYYRSVVHAACVQLSL